MRRSLAITAVLAVATSLAACGDDEATCGSASTVSVLRKIIDGKGLAAMMESAAKETSSKASYDIDEMTTNERMENGAKCSAVIATTITTKDGKTAVSKSATFEYKVMRTDAGKMKVIAYGL